MSIAPLGILLILLGLIAVLVLLLRPRAEPPAPSLGVSLAEPEPLPPSEIDFRPRKQLLSYAERAFFQALRLTAHGQHFCIVPKVGVRDLLNWPEEQHFPHGLRLLRFHVDFVLCRRGSDLFEIVAAIELDDQSHNLAHRIKRDQLINEAFAAAGLSLIRFRARAHYRPEEIEQVLRERIGPLPLNRRGLRAPRTGTQPSTEISSP